MPWVDRALLVVFSLLLVGGIVVYLVSLRQDWEKMMRKMLRRAAEALVVCGGFGLLLYGLTYERIPYLGARVGYIVWLAVFAWYAWKLWKFVKVEIPALEQRQAEREQFNKWLPKSKK